MATYFNQLSTSDKVRLISEILSVYNGMNEKAIQLLIEKTDEVKGVTFVNIKGYCSDKSGNTEVADQRVNIGASYTNMQRKDADKYNHVDFLSFCALVDGFNLQYVNLAGVPENAFKQAVKDSFVDALTELQNPKTSGERADYFIHFNKVLAYNTNTKNLSIFGMQVTKTVTQKGETKMVKSAPKTIAKQLINKSVESRTSTLRRFNIGNITNNISIMNDSIELG